MANPLKCKENFFKTDHFERHKIFRNLKGNTSKFSISEIGSSFLMNLKFLEKEVEFLHSQKCWN